MSHAQKKYRSSVGPEHLWTDYRSLSVKAFCECFVLMDMHDLKKYCTSHLHIPIHRHHSLLCKCIVKGFNAEIQASTKLWNQANSQVSTPVGFHFQAHALFGSKHQKWTSAMIWLILVSQLPSERLCHFNPNFKYQSNITMMYWQ